MLLDKIKLESDEKVILQIRRHWFILFGRVGGLILAAITPPLLLLFVQTAADDMFTINLSDFTAALIFIYTAWLLFLWLGIFSVWTNYYLDILTLTDRRIILINQKGFFRRNTASFRLEKLQDMNVEINGFIATLLDYGTIDIETAGHGDDIFHATGLPKPRELKSAILTASDDRISKEKDDESV